ncbi:NADH-quinone oxidoreductase subunit G [Nocardia cyriacigeorgica]|uniref:NADH-quinone oxidoreductase subunit G n=1 Tax=Nocardia cyriacigeorgica TaxID=135487 RepID=UPI0018950D8E|nr:NADH-quinone oxidoreductase subunit G [Nocardia cyriacigeorgica]MBF6162524.1 NADH-quinone oxidoreductase subunit G [Nocardia cyriacigeorgica]MBF6201492.1 NADH-quinone oxidoreductase subunit G [Nocardia cyriacigeorgica]MBF6317091.1 NADH-quinone oxidoreductase subunit G [Nocardia cyriacigeorgica]MBF6347215.1 NADH-quinone oxidoreductase subunit G [Nocardia cyriacigeorgica]MBF6532357.1 NADH-quinone oxidoreductase subunit G [Nocardia cyriacigeorgica]
MTATVRTDTSGVVPADLVSVTIDGTTVSVPAGTLLIRAAELIGIQIPRFCDHPLLEPVGACRQCLVEVDGQRKPVASCTMAVSDGMVAHTQLSSTAAEKAQRGVMELLLINHPLDCPVCDKGGECPLQNQAMSTGSAESRFDGVKRTFPKPIPLSTAVLLDRERCVLCARCTRFSQQIAGDPFIELLDRGALQQVGTAQAEPLDSYFSGNTVQICPVGALTGTSYRFRARPFDLVSSPNVCEHCASGCAQRTDHRRGKVLRRLAGDDPQVNEEWNCDKGRWAFAYATEPDRLTTPLVRGPDGELAPASWSQALAVAARGLAAAISNTGVLVGGRVTMEDAYAYAKFARLVLGTNDIDARARVHSAEEADFLAARVAGQGLTVGYDDLEAAPVVLLAGFEPEEESPIVYLRLRKAARKRGLPVYSMAAYASRGVQRMSATLLPTVPGAEPHLFEAIRTGGAQAGENTGARVDSNRLVELAQLLRKPGAVIMVGERLAGIPGALSAAVRLADDTGAALAWVPRRAGERGAIEAGALPGLLPGGRPVCDPEARRQIQDVWGAEVPVAAGRDTAGILDPAAGLALVVGGVELADLPDPRAALAAVRAAPFVVSLELRRSEVTDCADVVFPVASAMEKAGTYLNWEGRPRAFEAALGESTVRRTAAPLSDLRVLHTLAAEMGTPLGLPDTATARAELAGLGAWNGTPAPAPAHLPHPVTRPGPGTAVLAGWRMLLDAGRMQDGEPNLAGTAHPAVLRLSPASAAEIGAENGEAVTVATEHGALTLPLVITDMPDRVVWVPMNAPGHSVPTALATHPGGVVELRRAGLTMEVEGHE